MIVAIALGILGVIVALTGVITMLASAMPSFGGRDTNAERTLLFGFLTFLLGVGITFYAGMWV